MAAFLIIFNNNDIHAEHIKYAPSSIHENIAHILNTTAKDGNPPDELKIGILTPLPKPGKKKGPPGNLRPIRVRSGIMSIVLFPANILLHMHPISST